MDDFGRTAIGFIGTSLVCWVFVFIAISAGAGDGSNRLVHVLGFLALLGAFVGGLVGLVLTLASSLPRDRKRQMVVMSLPGILCPVWLVIAVFELASQMN